jgi:hypothetical protein
MAILLTIVRDRGALDVEVKASLEDGVAARVAVDADPGRGRVGRAARPARRLRRLRDSERARHALVRARRGVEDRAGPVRRRRGRLGDQVLDAVDRLALALSTARSEALLAGRDREDRRCEDGEGEEGSGDHDD